MASECIEQEMREVDEYKICFIICANKDYFLEECLLYLEQLEVPKGYEVEVISVTEAKSMAAGYNEGMNATNAKYKIYLHQDVFIVYKGFLQAVLDIFAANSSIGLIGMVGAPKMSVTGVMWAAKRVGKLYGQSRSLKEYGEYRYSVKDGAYEVEAIDGLMMITNRDIPWREDIFDGWDFYDVSQSFEFQKAGYKVVVPEQHCPWCIHEGILNMAKYNLYRKRCMSEYPKYFKI